MQETQFQSLGWEDPLEKEMATPSSILAWRIPWTEGPGGLQSVDLQSRTRLKRRSSSSGSAVKNLFAMQEMGSIPESGRSPGERNGKATHPSILDWEIPWTEGPGGLQSMGLQKSQIWFRHKTTTCSKYLCHFIRSLVSIIFIQFSSIPNQCCSFNVGLSYNRPQDQSPCLIFAYISPVTKNNKIF